MSDLVMTAWFCAWCILAVLAFELGRERGKREGMKIDVTVDAALQDRINGQIVSAWLDKRGLCWMPKGIECALKEANRR